jgi:hypothetical protein
MSTNTRPIGEGVHSEADRVECGNEVTAFQEASPTPTLRRRSQRSMRWRKSGGNPRERARGGDIGWVSLIFVESDAVRRQLISMKLAVVVAGFFLGCSGVALASEGHFLNLAILRVPAVFLADIPAENRVRLLEVLSSWTGSDEHLDYEHGWVHYFYDGPAEDSPGGTSQFWMKVLPRKGQIPLVLIHMPKRTRTATPTANETVVLELGSLGRWNDVTKDVMPAEVDLTMHFRPRRMENRIEVARYEKFERKDGRGQAYKFGKREVDLIWEDGRFRVVEPDGQKLSAADGRKASE